MKWHWIYKHFYKYVYNLLIVIKTKHEWSSYNIREFWQYDKSLLEYFNPLCFVQNDINMLISYRVFCQHLILGIILFSGSQQIIRILKSVDFFLSLPIRCYLLLWFILFIKVFVVICYDIMMYTISLWLDVIFVSLKQTVYQVVELIFIDQEFNNRIELLVCLCVCTSHKLMLRAVYWCCL